MHDLIHRARQRRWLNLAVANLRILLGFAFLPAGLKKLIGQPFTDPDKTGAFHEFLHSLHGTGVFYHFIGAVQLTIAILLLTQTFATLGALMALPVFATITVFCWSTNAIPTAIAVSLMLLGTGALVLWDLDRWRDVVRPLGAAVPSRPQRPGDSGPIDMRLWRGCGLAILALYVGVTAASGGIYRPKTIVLDDPAFYVLPLIALFPFVTFAIEQARRRSGRRRLTPSRPFLE